MAVLVCRVLKVIVVSMDIQVHLYCYVHYDLPHHILHCFAGVSGAKGAAGVPGMYL